MSSYNEKDFQPDQPEIGSEEYDLETNMRIIGISIQFLGDMYFAGDTREISDITESADRAAADHHSDWYNYIAGGIITAAALQPDSPLPEELKHIIVQLVERKSNKYELDMDTFSEGIIQGITQRSMRKLEKSQKRFAEIKREQDEVDKEQLNAAADKIESRVNQARESLEQGEFDLYGYTLELLMSDLNKQQERLSPFTRYSRQLEFIRQNMAMYEAYLELI